MNAEFSHEKESRKMTDNSHNHSAENHQQEQIGPPRSLKILTGIIFLIGGGYYLWTQHRAHVLQYWPVAIFLLCPLMHFFGHRGHGVNRAPGGREGEPHG